MHRRRFILVLASAPLAAKLACKPSGRGKRRNKSDTGPLGQRATDCRVASRQRGKALNPRQWRTYRAACERIIPADRDPGATDADVISFLDEQLSRPPIAAFLPLFAAGDRWLNLTAMRRFRRPFFSLPPQQQDAMLSELLQTRLGDQSGARLFDTLLGLTLEGFFGDPIYGGNRDERGWQMLKHLPRIPRPACPRWARG
ncbi:MAG: gluconate 2-dehydrogenase subunit 3 family protein [Deltaproteobacteria bacterium]|nr:gluconate 2-dehydrogenase subunit 3 family protein [Deltaproteobacteria bacterium]